MHQDSIAIEIRDEYGNVRQKTENRGHCELVWYGSYEPGDHIIVKAFPSSFVRIQIDQKLPPAEVYIKKGCFDFPVPFGCAKEAYPEEAFTGVYHQLSAYYPGENRGFRLLSENPLDIREEDTSHLSQDSPVPFFECENEVYPHCTASVETRKESVFAARNTIDGMIITEGHGHYPFTSWGNANDPDSHIDLWFGRSVCVEEIHLFLRTDFPHDNHWKEVTLFFDDGHEIPIALEKTGACQSVILPSPRVTSYIRLGKLKKDENNPSPFASLVQWRVFGREV